MTMYGGSSSGGFGSFGSAGYPTSDPQINPKSEGFNSLPEMEQSIQANHQQRMQDAELALQQKMATATQEAERAAQQRLIAVQQERLASQQKVEVAGQQSQMKLAQNQDALTAHAQSLDAWQQQIESQIAAYEAQVAQYAGGVRRAGDTAKNPHSYGGYGQGARQPNRIPTAPGQPSVSGLARGGQMLLPPPGIRAPGFAGEMRR